MNEETDYIFVPPHCQAGYFFFAKKREIFGTMFVFGEADILFQVEFEDKANFFWRECTSCIQKFARTCPSGWSAKLKGKCNKYKYDQRYEMTSLTIERKIPEHVWISVNRSHYLFALLSDTFVPMTITNVSPNDGHACFGGGETTGDPITDYNLFWDLTKDSDYLDRNQFARVQDSIKYWTPESASRWSVDIFNNHDNFTISDLVPIDFTSDKKILNRWINHPWNDPFSIDKSDQEDESDDEEIDDDNDENDDGEQS